MKLFCNMIAHITIKGVFFVCSCAAEHVLIFQLTIMASCKRTVLALVVAKHFESIKDPACMTPD